MADFLMGLAGLGIVVGLGLIASAGESVAAVRELVSWAQRSSLDGGRLAPRPSSSRRAAHLGSGYATASPRSLYLEAVNASDPDLERELLLGILNHPNAASDDLEGAGDIARRDLGDDVMARTLYERAVAADPANVSALAELLHLQASDPNERRVAVESVLNLARQHPNQRVVLARALDALIEVEDYKRLAEFANEMMPASSFRGLLWRNIAIAREELGLPDDAVTEAFENALEAGKQEGRVTLANVVRSFSRYLLGRGPTERKRALELLDESIETYPASGELLLVRGEVLRADRQYEQALVSLGLAERLGPPEVTARARRAGYEAAVLRSLEENSLAPFDSVESSVTGEAHAQDPDRSAALAATAAAEEKVLPFAEAVERRTIAHR